LDDVDDEQERWVGHGLSLSPSLSPLSWSPTLSISDLMEIFRVGAAVITAEKGEPNEKREALR
jgi:hypothetical protein